MRIKSIFLLFFVASSFVSMAQTNTEIIVPQFNDKYSEYVKKLESGQTDIDYKAFRESFIESQQFIIASKQSTVFDSLQKVMHEMMQKQNYEEIIKVTKQMLSIDYTSLMAHKILQQTYKIIGDTVKKKRYHDIEFGLLYSIIKNGDGKTCASGWPVIQISEEYFILQMVGAQLKQQSLDNSGGICDKMEVTTDEGEKTYYFEASKIFEGYKKLGLK